jgi:AraC family transcriptional regulator
MKYRIVERDVFQAAGLAREFSCGPGDAGIPGVPEFWDEVSKDGTANKLHQLNNGEIKGLLGITQNYNAAKNTVDYMIAAEHQGDVPGGFVSFEFPASKWVVFEVQGPVPTAIVNAWKQIYSEWFPSSGYKAAQIPPIEAYIDPDPSSPNSNNEIWVAVQ